MKKNVNLFNILTIVASLIIAAFAVDGNIQYDIESVIKDISSDKFDKRIRAINVIMSRPEFIEDKNLQNELIGLLAREIEEKYSEGVGWTAKFDTEGEVDYIFDLMDIVSRIDSDGAFMLIKKVGSSSNLSNFGEKGLLEIMNRIVEQQSRSSVLYFKRAFANDSISKEKKEELKPILINMLDHPDVQHPDSVNPDNWNRQSKALAWKNAGMRKLVIEALSYYQDEEVRVLLNRVKNEDGYWEYDKSGGKIYPVRDEAQQLLKDVK